MQRRHVMAEESKREVMGPEALSEELKLQLGIKEGDPVEVWVEDGVTFIKRGEMPSVEELQAWMLEAQQWARESGLTEQDVKDVIKEVRARRRMQLSQGQS